ncbi:MAG: ATP-grasp domain-containing protein [Clostridiales Family XIII bacterium]|nr:ATP-grasp domain-containing protein [Clostridiales Family XIII bacterium]
MERPFIPLLFAADINVYSVARAFHEEYGVVSHAFGKALSGPCADSRIIRYSSHPKADSAETVAETVAAFAKAHRDKKIIVLGCGDNYIRQISNCKGSFPANVIAPYINVARMDRLIHKERFYELCAAAGVDYPDTFIHRKGMGDDFSPPFGGPFIIKPSNGIEYWEHPFEGQHKVFKADSLDEAKGILGKIYASGYSDTVVVQDFIPGDDSYMRVLTNYSDSGGKVKLSCFGHVLLEEHTPHGSGNHAVIITRSGRAVEEQFRKLLEGLNYVGFSNFDIKYDSRDGKYKVFELNARQGRSNYYVTGSGENIARYLVDDLIYQKELPKVSADRRTLWMVVPKRVAFQYVGGAEYREEMRELISAGRWSNPLLYDKDRGLKRGLRVRKNLLSHFYKFHKYYKI